MRKGQPRWKEPIAIDAAFVLARRKETGLSQSEFARVIGVSRISLWKWETGRVTTLTFWHQNRIERGIAKWKMQKQAAWLAMTSARPPVS